jgi:predicted aspartyl protease
MHRTFSRVIALLFTLPFILSLTSLAVTRNDTKDQTLRFDLYHGYLIVARGSIGPLSGLNFLVDTGASPTVLDRKLAQKLHLEESPAALSVLDGTARAGWTVAPTVQIGPLQTENLSVAVEDLSFFQKALNQHIDAVVGLDVLGAVPFEIDYRSNQIHFGVFPQFRDSLTFETKRGLPIVEAELNHVPLRLLVDTGASSFVLFGPSTPRTITPTKVSLSIGESEHRDVVLRGLHLGQTQFGPRPAIMVRRRTDGITDFDGLLSPVMLGITKIAIDREHGKIGFSQ